jgi:cyanophycin synthetase
VIEVNASPGLLAHLKPLVGKPRPVGEAIVNQLFAPGEQGRVPLVAVSGTRNRIETTQLISRCLATLGHEVVRADSSGLYLGERLLKSGAATNAEGARRALMNPSATAADIETSELATLEGGIAFDGCKVAIVTSTTGAEELARPGVEDRVAIDKAIRAPLDVVTADGFGVLNADDPVVVTMAERCPGKVVWFGLELSPLIQEHVSGGGSALVRLGSQLVWWESGEKSPPLSVSWLSESTALTRVEPLMASAAAALALGVARPRLEEFLSNYRE